jgi:polyisoprenoid-binding protein YceI
MGDEITFQITGDLTVRQATLPVTFEVKARLLNNELSGTAETTVSLGDFGVGPIEIAGMLKTEDTARLVLNFVARP